MRYATGVDSGTESGRAAMFDIVDVDDEPELASSVHRYACGAIDHTLPTASDGTPLCFLPEADSGGKLKKPPHTPGYLYRCSHSHSYRYRSDVTGLAHTDPATLPLSHSPLEGLHSYDRS